MEATNGTASLQRGNAQVQFWPRTQHLRGATAKQGHDQQHARRQYHGSQAHDEHHAFRHVHQPGESIGGGSHRRSLGDTNADALHSGYDSALGTRRAHGFNRQSAGSQQYLEAHVQLGWCHRSGGTRTVHAPDPVNGTAIPL